MRLEAFNIIDEKSIVIKDIPQLFSYNSNIVTCEIAKTILELLPVANYIIDSRVHMLKPSWYPCIPGWHFDEMTRDSEGKLDYKNNNYNKKHYLFILDQGTGSLTEFYDYNFAEFGIPKDYSTLNAEIESNKDENRGVIINSNSLYSFSSLDAHRGLPAIGNGWRYFIRFTVNTQREYLNEVRTQTQTYIPDIDVGW